MGINAPTHILALAILLAAEPAIAGMPFPLAGLPFFLAMNDFRKETDKFLDKKCLPDSTIKPFEKLLKKAGDLQKAAAQETDAYMGAVSTPMPGSGKCDGGFEAVAAESDRRSQRTLDSLKKWSGLGAELGSTMVDTFKDPKLAFLAQGTDESCAQAAQKDFDKLKDAAVGIGKQIENVQNSLIFEFSRFTNYRDANKKLQARCGQSEPGTEFQAIVPPDFSIPSPAIAGKSKNGQSDVTGLAEDLAKQKELEGADRHHFTQVQVHSQTIEPEVKQTESKSDITNDIVEKLDGFAKLVDRHPGADTGVDSLPLGAQQSAGAALWDMPKDPSVYSKKLELNQEAKQAAENAKALSAATAEAGNTTAPGRGGAGSATLSNTTSDSVGRQAGNPNVNEGMPPSISYAASTAEDSNRTPASTGSAQQGQAIAPAEADLFRLVHARYQETELFRRAKATKVPLNSFDSNLKR